MDNKKIGSFICELRKEKELTQYELAEKIPVSREAISKWERGVNKPDKSCIESLCKIFNVTPEEIILGKKEIEKKDIENLTLDLYEDINKKKVIVKLCLTIILIISFLFLIYYFIENYNSIHVYTINYNDDNVTITNGIFTTTKEKIYFYLGEVTSDKDIKKIKLYYKDKFKNEKLIYATDEANIMLYDYRGYNAYFNFEDLKHIMENAYIEVEFEDDKHTIKIDFVNDFSNKKIFNKNENNISDNGYINDKININKIKEKLTLENDLYTYSNNKIYITYVEDINMINLVIDDKKINKEWNYYIDLDLLSYNEYSNKEVISSFTNQDNNIECLTGKCGNYKEITDYFFDEINKLY